MEFLNKIHGKNICIHSVLSKCDQRRPWKHAVVIQGPYYKSWTSNVISIFLKRNSDCLVIVSTCVDEDIPPFDLNEFQSFYEEGRLIYILIKTPVQELSEEFWKTNYHNQNLQRLTSFVGLSFAEHLEITNVLKVRSDVILGRENICEYLNAISEIPLILPKDHILKNTLRKRIVVSNMIVISPSKFDFGKYFIPDKFYFGDVSDLLLLFDMRDGCSWDHGKGIDVDRCVENNLTKCWMNNVGIKETPQDNLEICARYLGIVSAVEVEFIWQKEQSFEEYKALGKKLVARIFDQQNRIYGFPSVEDWVSWMKTFNL